MIYELQIYELIIDIWYIRFIYHKHPITPTAIYSYRSYVCQLSERTGAPPWIFPRLPHLRGEHSCGNNEGPTAKHQPTHGILRSCNHPNLVQERGPQTLHCESPGGCASSAVSTSPMRVSTCLSSWALWKVDNMEMEPATTGFKRAWLINSN